MKVSIIFLFTIMILLLWNIIMYFLNEDYRFFIEKIKHQDEIINNNNFFIDDSVLLKNEKEVLNISWEYDTWENDDYIDDYIDEYIDSLEFLESTVLSRDVDIDEVEIIPSEESLEIVSHLKNFNLINTQPEIYLFWITNEYPDPFLQWFWNDVTLYFFSTKTYKNLYDIFDILSFYLPISLNEINNFWSRSFFINMSEDWEDDFVRVVFEYKNQTFWLKIKNIYYNQIRDKIAEL